MEVPTVEDVLQAINSLHHAPSREEKQKASTWLTSLVHTVHIWEIADKLLYLKQNVETSFFGAQAMQLKIRSSFHELPQESHESLKASLMNHLEQLADGPSPVIRQLAMALVDLLIQMADCSSIVRDLVGRFGAKEVTACVLLEVLTLLPEEIHNRGLRLGQNRRKELTESFGREWLLVLELLVTYLTSLSNSKEVVCRVFYCLGSWLQMGNFPEEVVQHTTIMQHLFALLHRVDVPEKVYEAATECVCSAVFVCDNDSYQSLALELHKMVLELQPVFLAAMQSEDFFRAQSLSRIFIEMADAFLYHMIHHTTEGLGSLDSLTLLLHCVGHPDYEIVGSTFNVWYRLAEELSKINDPDIIKTFQPYIQKLISQLCVHCQIDEDTSATNVMTDESDDFITFRTNVVELVKDVNFIVGPKSLFEELYLTSCKPGVAWNVRESSLFIMYAIASSLKHDENEVLPIALPVLLSIPPDTHFAIRATTLRLVGELAAWIDNHPEVLDTVFNFIEAGLKIPALANAAATAVQCVCLKCKDKLGQRMNGLLEVIQVAYQGGVSNDTMLGLLKGIVEVITRQPPENMNKYLEFLCTPPYEQLLSMASNTNISSNIPRGSSTDPCVWLDRLSTIFRSCVLRLNMGEIHPCTAALNSCLPLVVKVCYAFKHETRIVERSCRCLRFMLRTFGVSAVYSLELLLKMCMEIYQEYNHSCFLYLGSIIVDEFGSNTEYQTSLVLFLEHMANITFPILASQNGLLHHPDTVDDMFRLCARFLQRCPIPFLNSPVYPVAVECSLAAILLNHRDAYASVMKFFKDLLSMSIELPEGDEKKLLSRSINDFLTSHGTTVIDGLLNGFVFLPSVMISESAEVLWALLVYARGDIVPALAESVDRLKGSKAEITLEQKKQFIASVSSCQSIDDLHGYIRDYSRLYR